jgi:hypothetical protein
MDTGYLFCIPKKVEVYPWMHPFFVLDMQKTLDESGVPDTLRLLERFLRRLRRKLT